MIPPHGAFGGIEFAQQDGPSSVQSCYDCRVKVRHMLRQGFGTAHGAHACGHVDEKKSPPFRRPKQADLPCYECDTLLNRIFDLEVISPAYHPDTPTEPPRRRR